MRIFTIVRPPNDYGPIDCFASHERRLDSKGKVETRYLAATKQARRKAALTGLQTQVSMDAGMVAAGGYILHNKWRFQH